MTAGVPASGEIVGGKYQIESVLGAGGMGIVFSAVHIHLQERVAIKLLSPDVGLHTEAVARFVREARAACRIKSEHVARVSDVGTLETGVPYLVMEYLEGRDLARELGEVRQFPVSRAVDFVLQACEAIAEAHLLGIVHRDLKPANLFLIQRRDGTPCIKVLDFGISKITHPRSGSVNALTDSSAVMGSPLYMSPEQLRAARTADERADIWALGVILYELLCGQTPFSGETLPEVSVKIAVDPPAPLRAVRRDVPQALENVILRCLEKNREKRFATVAELAAALAKFGDEGARVSAERITRVAQAAHQTAPGASEPGKAGGTTANRPTWQRRRGVLSAIAVLGIGALVGKLASVSEPKGDVVAQPSPTPSPSSSVVAATINAEPTVVPMEPAVLPRSDASTPAASGNLDFQPSPPSLPPRLTAPNTTPSSTKSTVSFSAPPGTYALIDGRPLGAVPVTIPVPAGEHVAKFVRDGETISRTFSIAPGESTSVRVGAADFNIPNPYRRSSDPTAPSAANSTAFNRDAAISALERAASRARACARPEGPSGEAVVRTTFSPTGTARAVITGGLAGTAVGACVETAFASASVAPFDGPAVTLATRVVIR